MERVLGLADINGQNLNSSWHQQTARFHLKSVIFAFFIGMCLKFVLFWHLILPFRGFLGSMPPQIIP
jgi:hypothetical protein